MKSLPVLILVCLWLPIAVQAQDPGVSKSELLEAVNSFDGLNLQSDEEDALKEANNKVVDNLFSIANSDDDSDEKLKKFKKAKGDNEKIFKNILSESDFKKYKKKVKKQIKPFKRKANLVKFLL